MSSVPVGRLPPLSRLERPSEAVPPHSGAGIAAGNAAGGPAVTALPQIIQIIIAEKKSHEGTIPLELPSELSDLYKTLFGSLHVAPSPLIWRQRLAIERICSNTWSRSLVNALWQACSPAVSSDVDNAHSVRRVLAVGMCASTAVPCIVFGEHKFGLLVANLSPAKVAAAQGSVSDSCSQVLQLCRYLVTMVLPFFVRAVGSIAKLSEGSIVSQPRIQVSESSDDLSTTRLWLEPGPPCVVDTAGNVASLLLKLVEPSSGLTLNTMHAVLAGNLQPNEAGEATFSHPDSSEAVTLTAAQVDAMASWIWDITCCLRLCWSHVWAVIGESWDGTFNPTTPASEPELPSFLSLPTRLAYWVHAACTPRPQSRFQCASIVTLSNRDTACCVAFLSQAHGHDIRAAAMSAAQPDVLGRLAQLALPNLQDGSASGALLPAAHSAIVVSLQHDDTKADESPKSTDVALVSIPGQAAVQFWTGRATPTEYFTAVEIQIWQNASAICAHNACDKPPTGTPLLKCGRCKSVWYCGTECQAAAWKGGHKDRCKLLSAAFSSITLQRSWLNYQTHLTAATTSTTSTAPVDDTAMPTSATAPPAIIATVAGSA